MWRAGYGQRAPGSRGIGCLPVVIGILILIALIVVIVILLRH